jgi:RNA polymerase sigma-70 factor (ECF subfamily)
VYDKLLEKYIDMYQKLIFSVCNRYIDDIFECENIVQDTYLSFYSKMNEYAGLPENDVKNLLCRIALNKTRDYYKSAYITYVDRLLDIENIEKTYEIENEILDNDRKKSIGNIINEISEPYSSVLKEYYIKELTLDEIARNHLTKKDVIKVQLYRGKKKMKENLLKKGGINVYE